MQFPQCKNQRTLKFRRISTIRLQDLKYSPGNCMRNCKAPSDWRVPEGPDAAPVDGSGAWPGFKMTHRSARQEPLVWRAPEGSAAVPVGGGGAWPGLETAHHRTALQVPPVWRAPEGPEGTGKPRTATSPARLEAAAGPAGPGRASRRRAEPPINDPAPLVWRVPEGPEGTGGLRGAAPNEVRPPSLAGGRALRRPEHQRRNKHQHVARTTRGRAAAHGRTK